MDQGRAFLSGEGDSWFRRNESLLASVDQAKMLVDVIYIRETLVPFKANINNILEIGSSNGLKLEALCQEFGANGAGIDPSQIAVDEGRARKKCLDLDLRVGVADDLPYDNDQFDLVHFGFCLYLCDRSSILLALAEADRVLKAGGFLIITDFDPGTPYKRSYSHMLGVNSYKQDYSRILIDTHGYYLSGKRCFSHRGPHFEETADERISTSILYKEIDPYLSVG